VLTGSTNKIETGDRYGISHIAFARCCKVLGLGLGLSGIGSVFNTEARPKWRAFNSRPLRQKPGRRLSGGITVSVPVRVRQSDKSVEHVWGDFCAVWSVQVRKQH